MESRRLRLGDIIDDYCPRERRLANHVVVVLIGDDIKQTRCTTCDTEHPYKNAKVPPRRKKPAAAALAPPADVAAERPRLAPDADEAPFAPDDALASELPPAPQPESPVDIDTLFAALDEVPDVTPAEPVEDGPVHRRLIRAQLPRLDGEAPARPIPEFTMRMPQGRPGRGGFGRHARANGRVPFAPGVMSSGTWTNGQNGTGNSGSRQKAGHGNRPHSRPGGFNKKSR